jgi:hypothetical protein
MNPTDIDGDTYVVLVAGEHFNAVKHLGGHASIVPIGQAYNTLRKYIPRERIIVIAQTQECLHWHLQDVSEKVKGITDPKRVEVQSAMWEEKKKTFLRHLTPLLEEGGADYEGENVNPETFLHVLGGLQSEKYPRVVKYVPGRTKVFVSMFGHGSWSGKHDNHYFWMPYPSPTVYDLLTKAGRPKLKTDPANATTVSTAGVTIDADLRETAVVSSDPCTPPTPVDGSAKPESESYPPGIAEAIDHPVFASINAYIPSATSAPAIEATGADFTDSLQPFRIMMHKRNAKQPSLSDDELNRNDSTALHWQFFFMQLREVFTNKNIDPKSIFIFQHSCGSGGMWKWLSDQNTSAEYHKAYQVKDWPLYVFYTSEPETSSVGSVWKHFFDQLSALLIEASKETKIEDAVKARNEAYLSQQRAPPVQVGGTPLADILASSGASEASEALSRPGSEVCYSSRKNSDDTGFFDKVLSHLRLGAAEDNTDVGDGKLPTIDEFYDSVSKGYYKGEKTLCEVNFNMSHEERASFGYQRFGVLGRAFGNPFDRGQADTSGDKTCATTATAHCELANMSIIEYLLSRYGDTNSIV